MPGAFIHAHEYQLGDRSLARIAWAPGSTDLHVNLVVLHPGEVVGAHVNATLDVLITCLAGEGELRVDDACVALAPGTIALVPAGAKRGVVAGNTGLRYTTCHRKRGGIVPSVQHKP